jgi:predicted nucleic acid-binding protein
MEEGWLCVKEPGNRQLVHALQRDLDKGEAEAIALALQVGAEWTLLDEREGRRTAKSLGLKVTGILGILLRAWREGELPSLQRVMQDLREKAGFHIGAELFAELLRESGE